jgi:hypothetical protein
LSSRTMSLVATTSSTCKSITGEGRGFSGASGTRGGWGIGVHKTTNSGETWEGSAAWERGRGERGEGTEKGDEAHAGGERTTGTKDHQDQGPPGPEAEGQPGTFRAGVKASGSWGPEQKGEAEREEEDRMDWACTKGCVINQTSSQGRKRTQTHRAQAHRHPEPQGETQTYTACPLPQGRGQAKE